MKLDYCDRMLKLLKVIFFCYVIYFEMFNFNLINQIKVFYVRVDFGIGILRYSYFYIVYGVYSLQDILLYFIILLLSGVFLLLIKL